MSYSLPPIDYAISTIERPTNYIHLMLARLRLREPVRLVVGSPAVAFLERFRNHSRFEIVEMPEDQWNTYKDSVVHRRAAFNYWRCLTQPQKNPNAEGILVLEDDLLPALGWQRRFAEVARDIQASQGRLFVLSLYAAYDFPPLPGTHYAVYPVGKFYGTQAMYYPNEAREGFAKFLRSHGVETYRAPYDMLLREYMDQSGIPLFAATPSLFEHVGHESTGLGLFHQAGNFKKFLYPGFNPWAWIDSWIRDARRSLKTRRARQRAKAPPPRPARIPFPDQTFQTDGMRVVHTRFKPSVAAEKREAWQTYLEKIPQPPAIGSERGIVICAGGVRFLTCAYVGIQMLRKHGCALPVEVWHLDHEISKEFASELAKLDVQCRNLREASGLRLNTFQTKSFALLHSRFREILFLDADNVCTRDPSFLFECAEFDRTGAVFWPDYWRTDPDNAIWQITDTEPDLSLEQESGQLLIDKARCWRELQLACHFNEQALFYYQLLNGDKDTFKFAWLALKTPFCMMPHEVGQCGYVSPQANFVGTTMVQHDFERQPLFMHRNLRKWDVTHDGEVVWRELRRFRPDARRREYYLNTDGDLSMNISGEIEKQSFPELFPNLEKDCLGFLRQLRESEMYTRFLIDTYILFFRYGGGGK